ncbi:hypothetical protein [Leptospira sp. GIMC2001]|uniref:hypothetical protein n=1 Tax=Leptospira sp. GIMC2001 TaxID=1513297 RepID=UPI002349032A|nr:hypothetical protein [Leptospira sp. GIMC2001]WCL48536.1 hypothetical protein O4O04_14675 [Leptospira sp. GIMC2001]
MAEPKDNLTDEDLNILQGILEPLNKNPLSSEDLNPMAKVFRQKMGYAEPVQFSDEPTDSGSFDDDSETPASDVWADEDSGSASTADPMDDLFGDSANDPAPPSFKTFDDDDIDLDDLLAEPKAEATPSATDGLDDFAEKPADDDPFSDMGVDFGAEPSPEADDDFAGMDDVAEAVPSDDIGLGNDFGADDFGSNDFGNDLDSSESGTKDSDDDIFGDLGQPEATPKEETEDISEPQLADDPFADLGAEPTSPAESGGDDFGFDSAEDPFADTGTATADNTDDPFGDLGGTDTADSLGDDPFSDFGAMESPGAQATGMDDDPFGDIGSSDSVSTDDPFGDLGATADSGGMGDDPFGDFGGMDSPSDSASTQDLGNTDDSDSDPFGDMGTDNLSAPDQTSIDNEDPFGDLGVDLSTSSPSSEPDLESTMDPMDDLMPPDLDEIGTFGGDTEGVLEDELSSLMDQEEGSVDEGLTDEDLAIIQREIVKYPPKLRRQVIDSIVNNRIALKHQKELLELIKHQQKPDDIAEYLSGILGEEVTLFDPNRALSSDGVPIISTKPMYTREGALQRRKLLRNTIFASAAAILFVLSFVSLYKYVIIPGRAGSHYEEGLQAIRLYAVEKDENEKKRLMRDAKEFFAKGEEINPNNLHYLNAYGVEYMKAGRYDESFEVLFGKVEPSFTNWSQRKDVPYISIHPDSRWSDEGVEIAGRIADTETVVNLTSQDRKKRRVIKAGAYIVARVKEDIHDPQTYVNLGRFHSFHARDFREGDRSKQYKNDDLAIEYFKRVFTDAGKPDSIDARAGIAKIFYNQEEFPKAASEYNKIIEIYPKDPIGHGGLLSSFIEIWRRDRNPQFVLNHHRIVKNQLDMEEDLSLYILSKLASFYIDLDPEETRIRYNVNPEDQVSGLDIDDNAESLLNTIFNKEEKVDGITISGNKYAEGYYQRGRFFLKKNETLRAMKQFELAASYDPSHYPAVMRMGEYFIRVADYNEAEDLLKNADKRYLEFRDNYGRRDEDETLVDGDPGKIYYNRGKIIYLLSSGILENDVIREFPGRKIYPNRALVAIPERELDRRRGLYTASEFFSKAQMNPHALKDERAIRNMIYYEGWIDYMLGNFPSAINKWSELGEEDIYFNTTLILGMGNASYYTGQLNSALSNYLKVAEEYEAKEAMIKAIVEDDQDHQEIFQTLVAVYNNIGAVYERKGDMVQSLNYYWKAIETARKIELVSEIANSNKDLLMKKERLGQLPLLEDWLSPTLDSIASLIKPQ